VVDREIFGGVFNIKSWRAGKRGAGTRGWIDSERIVDKVQRKEGEEEVVEEKESKRIGELVESWGGRNGGV